MPEPTSVRVATNDVLVVDTPAGTVALAYSAWHTLVGTRTRCTVTTLRFEDGSPTTCDDGVVICEDSPRSALALAEQASHFAVAYGQTAAEARRRAEAGLSIDVWEEAGKRLTTYSHAPRVVGNQRQRLLNKCLSVIKVNTLAPEGVIGQMWSTPDRVPHRDMWLWDSVFHSLAMNRLCPSISWELLKSVLDTQKADGMIPHRASVTGDTSAITQPPLLAWGVWENYQVLRNQDHLRYAMPILDRYLTWDYARRDQNHNGLLEWFIEGNPKSRSGESGMDNSPRFDQAVLLDAVDFSTYAALDAHYLSLVARELGEPERAAHWQSQATETSAAIHRELWDEQDGFYYDRDLTGSLSRVPAASGFLPLLLGDIPQRHVQRLAKALQDQKRFGAAFPVPSVALAHPEFGTDMWRGATWLNLNYLIITGLGRQGLVRLAEQLRAQTLEHVLKYYERYGVLFEFFDARDELPPVACDRKGPRREPYDIRRKMDSIRDYHWTAALVACLLWDADAACVHEEVRTNR